MDKKSDFINFYELPKTKKYLKKANNPHYEETFIDLNSRVLICGGSGVGKTNSLIQYIYKTPDTFSKIIVVYKETEPLYEMLRDGIKKGIEFYTDLGKLGNIEKIRDGLDKDQEVLLVIDDWINEVHKYPNVGDIFTRGRKKGITTFFLTQSFFKTPKLLRQQMNYLLLFKMSSQKDINLILGEFGGKDPEEIRKIYKDATKEKLNFLKINTSNANMNIKFSKNWTNFYEVDDD